MDLLKNYDEGSNTPKPERYGQETSAHHSAEYDRMMTLMGAEAGSTTSLMNNTPKNSEVAKPSSSAVKRSSDHSSSGSTSGTIDGSSDEEAVAKKDRKLKHRRSESSDSSDSSSGSASEKSDREKGTAKQTEQRSVDKARKSSTSSASNYKPRQRRSRSRSGSKGRRRRWSSDKRRRSRSRSKDRRHRGSRSERRSGRHSRSRSRDRHRRRTSRDRRRRDGRRHRLGGSRDDHRRRRRHSPSHRRHRRSRSPEHKRPSFQKSRSRSPIKTEEVSSSNSGGKYTEFKTAGVKFARGRGRGGGSSFKDVLREQFVQMGNVTVNPDQTSSVRPFTMQTPVATQSAGTSLGIGGVNSAMLNQIRQQMLQQHKTNASMTAEETKAMNAKIVLLATNRTREQVEQETGVKVPEIYKETTNNLMEIAGTIKKRQILFKNCSKPQEQRNTSQWSAKDVLPNADAATAEKFSRLLGNKKHNRNAKPIEERSKEEQEVVQQQTMLNMDLMEQYEGSRMYTHLNRGAGLGYATTSYQPLN